MQISPRPIYIVDDDPGALNSMQFLLESAGYCVESFLDGETLIGHLRNGSPACMIVDYKLRGTNGVDFIQSMQASYEKIPAIVVTGHPAPSIRRHVGDAGLLLIEKPFSQNLLLAAVEAAAARH